MDYIVSPLLENTHNYGAKIIFKTLNNLIFVKNFKDVLQNLE